MKLQVPSELPQPLCNIHLFTVINYFVNYRSCSQLSQNLLVPHLGLLSLTVSLALNLFHYSQN